MDPCATLTPARTTPASRVRVDGSDRFIPSRHSVRALWNDGSPPASAQRTPSTQAPGKATTPAKESYQRMLSANLSDEGLHPVRRILKFTSPKKSSKPIDTRFQDVATRGASQSRRIPKAAELILDAPDLPDNFYLNLLDWSERNVVAIGLAEEVYVWNCSNGAVQNIALQGQGPVTSVAWGPDGRTLAVGFTSGDIELWNLSPPRKLKTIPGHRGRVDSLSWCSTTLASGGKDSSINLYDIRLSNNLQKKLQGHRDEVCGLKFSPSGNMLASGGNDNAVIVWDVRAAPSGTKFHSNKTQSLHQFNLHTAAVKALAWCPAQGSLLASGGGSSDRSIRMWNTQDGTLAGSLDTGSQVVALEWSPNGRELASAHGFTNNCINIWKYPSFLQLGQLEGHRSRILHMKQGPDGETLATAGADETLRIWKPLWSKEIRPSKGPEALLASTLRTTWRKSCCFNLWKLTLPNGKHHKKGRQGSTENPFWS